MPTARCTFGVVRNLLMRFEQARFVLSCCDLIDGVTADKQVQDTHRNYREANLYERVLFIWVSFKLARCIELVQDIGSCIGTELIMGYVTFYSDL